MTEQTQQGVSQAEAAPPRIQLDDFIEAVSRGVARALAAQDEVSGYQAALGSGSIVAGAVFFPQFPWPQPLDPNRPIVERR